MTDLLTSATPLIVLGCACLFGRGMRYQQRSKVLDQVIGRIPKKDLRQAALEEGREEERRQAEILALEERWTPDGRILP